ncbi:hypothetical protein L0664_17985 [Octadecabacter sp. G9-8]|uniref:Nucleotidyltransferase n=1 Tax=Octadecabacter dasysiphoniae TaxID=2909341 RepID=A0ABS9D0A6_9RHOB|nr:hypothetical protein [Octadecabacter dasysiphoniae]MCF2872960.1 hypothetical protein [Octadecabacter dasysiphoniae]
MTVQSRFKTFISNIALTSIQKTAGAERRDKVVQALNEHYWGSSSKTAHSKYVGSWGKFTRVRPPRDVDVLFTLPISVYNRFELRTGNKQSQLLQEVKTVLTNTFTTTAIKGSGPVVEVPFTSYNVEVVPAFELDTGRYWVCMTADGGSYAVADYEAEAEVIRDSNALTKDNTRNLIRMIKRWQAHCNVPIKSFWIELIAVEFLRNWEHRDKSMVYYDWMVRDFFAHLVSKEYGTLFAPGTYEAMYLGGLWTSKAKTAYNNAVSACEDEKDYPYSAGGSWQKIFGADIPLGG